MYEVCPQNIILTCEIRPPCYFHERQWVQLLYILQHKDTLLTLYLIWGEFVAEALYWKQIV